MEQIIEKDQSLVTHNGLTVFSSASAFRDASGFLSILQVKMLIQTNKALVHNRRRENSGVYQVKSYLFIYLFLLQKVFFGILNAAVPPGSCCCLSS